MDGKNLFLLKTAFTTEENYDFAKNSTIGVGGISPLAVFPNSLQQAVCLLDFFRKLFPFFRGELFAIVHADD